MSNLSVNIIVKDAATTLPVCLSGISGLTDDLVIVVDARTTDQTEKIARMFTARVINHTFTDFASQRNFAVSKSKYNWIFTLDTDETVSPDLYTFLKHFSPPTEYTAFSVRRSNIIFGRPIKHTNWDPNGLIRLFNKHSGRWVGQVHETWQSSGRVGSLKFPLIHQNYQTVSEFMSKLDNYTTAEAGQIPRFSLFSFIWQPTREFIRRFFIHAGFMDGYHGLYLSFLMWIYQVSIWIKVWQKEHVSLSLH
jgi:glycosyltransferase involved in cell wall biosynthesis